MQQKFKIILQGTKVKLLLILTLMIFSGFFEKSYAQNSLQIKEKPIAFTADEIIHDKKLGIMKASGSVEIFNNQQVLLADKISYNQNQDMVTASGNVSLLEPTGHVFFAEYMELSGDFKFAFIQNIKIRLSNDARIAANDAQRRDGNTTTMSNAVYSPCNTCATTPNKPPLWQLKAKKIIHDQRQQQLEYYDVWMEMVGIPVAYSPYFWHPDPTVKRKSGFLAPSTGGSTYLGSTLTTPYFYAISTSNDLTISPTITTKERLFMSGVYRESYNNGALNLAGSLAYNSNDDMRGHINSEAKFDLDEKFRWGLNINRSSDDTYLRRYNLPSSRILTTKAYVEGFSQRNYLSAEAYSFQGTAIEDDRGQTPLILPLLTYNHQSTIGRAGSTNHFNASSVVMTRPDGNNTRRISVDGGWHLPLIGRRGDITKISATTRGDLYHVSKLSLDGKPNKYTGFSGRIRPQIKADWRLPLARQHNKISQTLEPLASAILSPNGGNPIKIPNEDSISMEFDDTNLFSDNIFTGYDRVAGGARIKYGLKWGLVGSSGGYTNAFIGQRYRPRNDATFPAGSGLEGLLSDYVGRINISPGSQLNLVYRTRMDKDNFTFKRNEFQIAAGPPALRFSGNYIFFESQGDADFLGREEVSGNITAKLNRFWYSSIASRYDLEGNGDLRNLGLNLTYDCECFKVTTSLDRHFYKDRDIRPNDTIMVKFSFKTLGDIQTGIDSIK
ncbi:LPS assembly protein LptD [Gammaproteobacteria bacterium]|nr:LPS assembly protein LptD [Gammaproteobacteria bacterium]